MRPFRIASVCGWVTRRTRHDHLWHGAPGSGRGSVALGVAIVALTTRFHPHSGTSHGTFSTTGLIVVAIVIVISLGFRWFMRRRSS